MNVQKHFSIMILEDNHIDVRLLKEALGRAQLNFTAKVFEDGESAMRYIDDDRSDPAMHPVPDLAILDLNVPKRDGFEVLTQIGCNPRWRHVAVAVFSSAAKAVMVALAGQVDLCLRKPSELSEYLLLGETFRECLYRDRAGALIAAEPVTY